ncbi:MAG: transcription elongation factor GreB [Myxococcaceae bacterium]|nr:transcription elongation factor GreB [Myxococcaceae bacterium]
MSKAFKSNDDQPDDEPLDFAPPDDDDDPPRGKQYVTAAGSKKLHDELRQLLNVERPKVTAEVSAAAAQGDRSENAEYIYGKKRLREIDRRMHHLQKRIRVLTVVDPTEQKDVSRVYFGATVTLENEEDGTKSTYQLVGPDEIDTKGGRISVDSPIGKALLGRNKSDTVLVQRPKGEVELTIVGIKYV